MWPIIRQLSERDKHPWSRVAVRPVFPNQMIPPAIAKSAPGALTVAVLVDLREKKRVTVKDAIAAGEEVLSRIAASSACASHFARRFDLEQATGEPVTLMTPALLQRWR
jgi:hypothetical protein